MDYVRALQAERLISCGEQAHTERTRVLTGQLRAVVQVRDRVELELPCSCEEVCCCSTVVQSNDSRTPDEALELRGDEVTIRQDT